MRSIDGDLHTRARIRNAAIERFGQDGFGASVRHIAADAGVSPGLVIHHFGSKAGLREACDSYALELIHESKLEAVGPSGPEHMLTQLAARDEYAPVAAYAVVSLTAGGSFARALVEDMVASTREYLDAGVAAGTIRPSADPEARARYLTYSGFGMMLLAYHLESGEGQMPDLRTIFAHVTDLTVLPALEIFTHGLLTDTRYMDAYDELRETASDDPASTRTSHPSPAPDTQGETP